MSRHGDEGDIWGELDYLISLSTLALIIVFTLLYFAIPHWKLGQVLETFIMSIITNIIPVLLLFVISYALLRRFQRIRSRYERRNLINDVTSGIRREFEPELSRLQEDISEIRALQAESQRSIESMRYQIGLDGFQQPPERMPGSIRKASYGKRSLPSTRRGSPTNQNYDYLNGHGEGADE